jgi:hypothetical protein
MAWYSKIILNVVPKIRDYILNADSSGKGKFETDATPARH